MQTASYNVGVGHSTLGDTTTGHNNTALGNGALNDTTTGNNNVAIGSGAMSTSATASGEFTLGSGDTNNLRCNDQSISSLSDARDKTDVVNLTYGLDFINQTRPVTFKWETRDGNVKDGKTHNGFIAQELLALGNNEQHRLVLESNPEKLEAAYSNLIPMMVQAIQELSTKNDALEARITALEA